MAPTDASVRRLPSLRSDPASVPAVGRGEGRTGAVDRLWVLVSADWAV